ncbi:MAG: hypothetical protein WEG40_19705 [Candidatus Rokuibacteriota bacterium]
MLLLATLVGGALLLWSAPSASAVEYRLQVASVYPESFAAFLRRGEYSDGASGPGLDRLEASLERGQFPPGALLYDRGVEPAGLSMARAYRAVAVPARILRGGALEGIWDEIRWEGKPGEQSVWVISPGTPRHQELYRTALKGVGPLRQFQPYALRPNGVRLAVASLPLNFLWSLEGSETLWDKYLSQSLDLQGGIAAVVGANHNPLFGDQVFLVLRQAEAPTTYKAVLVWRRRPGVDRGNLEGPGNDTFR